MIGNNFMSWSPVKSMYPLVSNHQVFQLFWPNGHLQILIGVLTRSACMEIEDNKMIRRRVFLVDMLHSYLCGKFG